MIRRLGLVAAIVCAGAVALIVWRVGALPRAAGPRTQMPGTDVLVAYHVHTSRSDGTGTVDDVAAAAARAGLQVVIVTDHGDGTRRTDPPRYLHGVLVIDAVEISSWGGHYVALGAQPSPFPLGGEPSAVVEDVARLGGFGIAAHPGSSKEDLRWRGWDTPFDGVEWLNADSEWRDRPGDLWQAVLTYPWRSSDTIASLLQRPVFELHEWDRRARRRPVVGLAAHDAHARLGLRGVVEPYDGWVALDVPGYEAMFRAFANVVRLPVPPTGDAARDASAVLQAIRVGAVYSVISAQAAPVAVRFWATSGARTAAMGTHLAPAGIVRVTADVDAPAAASSAIVCDGQVVARAGGGRVAWTAPDAAGACRLEVSVGPETSAPWIVTNPIYVRPTLEVSPPSDVSAARVVVPVAGSGRAGAWAAETAPDAEVRLSDGGQSGRVTLTWRLGAGGNQFAAVRVDTPARLADFDRLVLRASADRPMRVWVQLRTPADGGRRWGRSVYLDESPRQVTLPFSTFLSLDRDSVTQLPLADVTALLLVVDTVHARPGGTGTITFDELWVAQ